MHALTSIFKIFSGGKKLLSDDDIVNAVDQIGQLSKEDLIAAYRISLTQPLKGVDTALLIGTMIGRLSELGIDYKKLTPMQALEALELSGAKIEKLKISEEAKPIDTAIFSVDLGVRSRELQMLKTPVEAKYKRNLKNSKAEIPCEVVGVYFTHRFGMFPFLSSLEIRVSEQMMKEYNLRAQRFPISEKSLRATAENWQKLLEQAKEISKNEYHVDCLCLRDFFIKDLKVGKLFPENSKKKKKIFLKVNKKGGQHK